MYTFLFLDLDNTILDFYKAEHIAVAKTLAAFGIDPTDAVCTRYSQINKLHWEMLERGELTREQVITDRFGMLFRELGVKADPAACAQMYEGNLSQGHYFLPGAQEALEQLSRKYRLYLASNGSARVQAGRLESARIGKFFEGVYISQEIGADKPSAVFFERCFARIPGFDRRKAIMVGDSLTSDILGGQNAGIATCWVNSGHAPRRPGIRVDYEIESLPQLYPLLETL